MIEHVDDAPQPVPPQHSSPKRRRRRKQMSDSLQSRTFRNTATQVQTSETASSPTEARLTTSGRRIVTVEFRSGEAVDRHPELRSLMKDGWQIESAVPDLCDEGLKLLVVMIRLGPSAATGSIRAD